MWVSFLHMFNSLLPKLGAHTGAGEDVGEGNGVLRCLWAHWVIHGQSVLGLARGLLDGVRDLVSRICVPARVSSATFPASSHTSVMQLATQYSGRDEREMSLFGRIPHSWGSCGLTHMLSLTPCGGNRQPRWSLLALSSATLGEGWYRLSQTVPPALSKIYNSYIFFSFIPVVYWNFSPGNLEFHKSSLIHWRWSETVVPQGLRAWSWFTGLDWVLYAYYTKHWWLGLHEGPLHMVLDPAKACFFVHGRMPNCCCWGGKYEWATSSSASCWLMPIPSKSGMFLSLFLGELVMVIPLL